MKKVGKFAVLIPFIRVIIDLLLLLLSPQAKKSLS